MKKRFFITALICCLVLPTFAGDYLISTSKTSLVIWAKKGSKPHVEYFGTKINESDLSAIRHTQMNVGQDSYPSFGLYTSGQKAIIATQSDGSMSLDLAVTEINNKQDKDGSILEIIMKDKVYPFYVIQYFKKYNNTDIISTWTSIKNEGKKTVSLDRFDSGVLNFHRANNWLTHFNGTWGAESMMQEEALTSGLKIINTKNDIHNTQSCNPSFMLTLDGKPQENTGATIGGVIAAAGAFHLVFDVDNHHVRIFAGMEPESSRYYLDKDQSLVTPEFAYTYSNEGKGGVSRAFHKWARKYKLMHGDQERKILLNSWEGVYMNIQENEMHQMMKDISDMGGELFVMDDGWFGNKYPRNTGSTSLGDWDVCKKKLPNGIGGLVEKAKENGIKFGIWIEPEMANTKSELFEKHPEWVLSDDNRPLIQGRGGTQVMLDLTNPEVQDFVFNVVDNIMTENPDIAYIKWDANFDICNYASHYLPKDRQSELNIEYSKGLLKTLKRVRAKYPDLTIQDCASGGGRVSYGLLPYFDEFWTSDDTDAYQRLYIQWGISNFYPSIAMASHVSADRNHQSGRITPLKFRFDVAMTGRLGMEIQPKNMSAEQKVFAKNAIKDYKSIRPIIQFGDLYRLVSPYENKGITSLMYTTPKKDKAVFFIYKMQHLLNMTIPAVKLDGLDISKSYRITEINPNNREHPYDKLEGKVISGKILKEEGLRVPLSYEYASMVLKLVAVN